MRMHAKQIAVAAGASGEMVEQVVSQMIADNNIRAEHAVKIVQKLKEVN
jgi:hydroxymethylglutaryl-CoA reductase